MESMLEKPEELGGVKSARIYIFSIQYYGASQLARQVRSDHHLIKPQEIYKIRT